LDDIAPHIQLEQTTGWLTGVTTTGCFHIAILQLNRPELIRYRRGQHELLLKSELLRQLLAENEIQQQIIEDLALIIAQYERSGE